MSEEVKGTTKGGTKSSKFKGFKEVLSGGKWINKNLNFFLFLTALAVLYIANGHMADRTVRNINKTQQEIKDLQFEYKTVKSEVMYKSEEAQVEKAAEPIGMRITKDVPVRLQPEERK